MRMWMIDPKFLCNKHLLGEHVEIHMAVGTVIKGRSLQGFIDKRILQPQSFISRHQALVNEMTHRNMRHRSPLPSFILKDNHFCIVDQNQSRHELTQRCVLCQNKMKNTGE